MREKSGWAVLIRVTTVGLKMRFFVLSDQSYQYTVSSLILYLPASISYSEYPIL